MRSEYREVFVNSAQKVLESMRCVAIGRKEEGLPQDVGIVSGEVLVVVPLAGDTDGNVILNMNTPTALEIIGKMAAVYGTALTPYGMDSLSELANVIIGNAVSILNDMGLDLRTRPPFVVTPGRMPEAAARIEACRIPLVTDCGVVTIHMVLNV